MGIGDLVRNDNLKSPDKHTRIRFSLWGTAAKGLQDWTSLAWISTLCSLSFGQARSEQNDPDAI